MTISAFLIKMICFSKNFGQRGEGNSFLIHPLSKKKKVSYNKQDKGKQFPFEIETTFWMK